MKHVLDTSALFFPAAIARMRRRGQLVLPVVAFTERLRQLRRDGRHTDVLLRELDRAEISVEPMGRDEALRAAASAPTNDRRWTKLSRDAFIAGHVGPHDEIWTANPTDFLELGLRADQVVDVRDV